MLREDVTREELRVYELYVERVKKHYDLVLTQFKIYFGFSSGLGIGVGFLLSPAMQELSTVVLFPFSFILVALGVVGLLLATAWYFVNRNARSLQLLMNDVLERVERYLFEDTDLALYCQINGFYSPHKRLGLDLLDMNSYVSLVFVGGWVTYLGFAIYLVTSAC